MIVSAAVKIILDDYAGTEFCIPVHRHKDIIVIGKQMLGYKPFVDEEGFLTDKGEFLDRQEAADHAYECGQLIETAEEPRIDKLMSEDLWQKGELTMKIKVPYDIPVEFTEEDRKELKDVKEMLLSAWIDAQSFSCQNDYSYIRCYDKDTESYYTVDFRILGDIVNMLENVLDMTELVKYKENHLEYR